MTITARDSDYITVWHGKLHATVKRHNSGTGWNVWGRPGGDPGTFGQDNADFGILDTLATKKLALDEAHLIVGIPLD